MCPVGKVGLVIEKLCWIGLPFSTTEIVLVPGTCRVKESELCFAYLQVIQHIGPNLTVHICTHFGVW